MAGEQQRDQDKLINEIRERFLSEHLPDKADKYDSRDVERLKQEDSWVEGYLQWRHYNVDEALKMIDESFQWRKEFLVHNLSESNFPGWVFETGAVYLHGYDKEGNKMFWFRVKLHTKEAKTVLDKKKCVAFWLERYAKREPGKPLTAVFDLTETGLSNIDMDFVRFIISCFKVYYPKYLSKMIIYEMPWIMTAAWKIVKSWLGPEAVSLLRFANKNDVQEYISIEYLPPHMGGIDPFKYSYPPLPDDDFQTPISENGPIASEDEIDEKESGDGNSKETSDTNHNDERLQKPKKVTFTEEVVKQDDERVESKIKSAKKTLPLFKGSLLHISPAEDLQFGSKDSGDRKCSIVLTNVTKNPVAFKVRTTAPEKYRVKPSNSSFEPGTTIDILVSLHGGFEASPQDRFLVMAAEIDQLAGAGPPDLSQYWKEVPRDQIMEHRLRCHIIESYKASNVTTKEGILKGYAGGCNQEDLHSKMTRLMILNKRLEEQITRCVWFQQLLTGLVALLVAITSVSLYLHSLDKDTQ
ncbi:motile sperm domain-containing protein 2 [Callorhinchus milii]|uniref:Motile sperm domain-containing 2 n=1 Tax=Callorhinchus milii TaxID=7868 RepID=V9KI65_CALMI|nr:motile sperm domain-containing protein 2 [Callorhinchus milii]|eukprot:gi/632948871/ref/XP_007889836.1/ PREDICTED: motile sperm domain-containing protein 2 [Callorhinchus milii]